jgi:hypothetical protein
MYRLGVVWLVAIVSELLVDASEVRAGGLHVCISRKKGRKPVQPGPGGMIARGGVNTVNENWLTTFGEAESFFKTEKTLRRDYFSGYTGRQS